MSGKAKFVHWMLSPFDDIPSEPMFDVIECRENPMVVGSTLCGGTLMTQYGINLPLFPDLRTWKRETDAKHKCFRCWATVRGPRDLARHRELVHHERAEVSTWPRFGTAVVLFFLVPLIGCNTIKRAVGVPTPGSRDVNVPVTTSLIRQLPPAPGTITFKPDHINGAPAKIRVFVKDSDWTVATPGAWYEIPVAFAADGRTTEYAVIDLAAQTAVVLNQPGVSPRAVSVESIPEGAADAGIPSAVFDLTHSSHDLY